MSVIPANWMPAVPMQRVIWHWTAGPHRANATDKRAYHILIEGDGTVVRGTPSIASNSGSLKSGYAAHTLNCNTGSIGVSMCSMAGAVESPFHPGSAPMTQVQWRRCAEVIAALCERYEIPVTPRTVLSHAEVQPTLGIAQRFKWDVARLAFDRSASGARAIGERMRAKVFAVQKGVPAMAPDEPIPAGGIGYVDNLPPGKTLNFRRSPNGDIVGSLPPATRLEIIGNQDPWLQVTTPAGHTGWVHKDYVDPIDGPPAQAPTTPDPRREALADIRAALIRLEASL